jgi:hypothetical protein
VGRLWLAAFAGSGIAFAIFGSIFISQEPMWLIDRDHRPQTLLSLYVVAAFIAPTAGGITMGLLYKAMGGTRTYLAGLYGSLTVPVPILVFTGAISVFLEARGFMKLALDWEYMCLAMVLLTVTYAAWWLGMVSIAMGTSWMEPLHASQRNMAVIEGHRRSFGLVLGMATLLGLTIVLGLWLGGAHATFVICSGGFELARCITWFHWLASYLTLSLTALMSIIMTFLQLRSGDGRWWWRSFMGGALTFPYMVAGGVVLLGLKGYLDTLDKIVVYVGYLVLMSTLGSMMLGAVAFCSSFAFVRFLYNREKVE